MSIDKTLKTQLNDYDIKEIAPKIYKINEYNLSTMFVIVGTKRALAIDCGVGVGDYKAIIEKLTGGLEYDLVLSHGHVDHAGGREQFDKIYINERDRKIIKQANLLYRKFYIWVMRFVMFFKCISYKNAKMQKVKKEPKHVPIKSGHIFDLGNKKIEVYESAGHTLGSVCFLDKTDKILFSGDTFNPMMLMFLPHSSTIKEYLNNIRQILKIEDYDTIWASHLSKSLTRKDCKEIANTAEKIINRQKLKHILPFVWLCKNGDKTIIYRINSVK